MKILLVCDYAIPSGGAEISTKVLRDGLRLRGHDVRIFASKARIGEGESIADYECFGTTSGLRTLLQAFNPWAYLRLRRVLMEFQPDVVHVGIFLTQLSPSILPLLRKVPSLYRAHWRRTICPIGIKKLPNGDACDFPAGPACYNHHCLPLRDWIPMMLQMKLWRRWRSSFNIIVANSEMIKRSLIKNGLHPVEVIYYGTPTRPIRPLLKSKPTIAFAGRLIPKKGVDVLIRGFAKVVKEISEAQLLIAGAGTEQVFLEKLIGQLGIRSNVVLCGHLPPQDMERKFSEAWAQVVPSRYEEPFGIVAIEAMMRGTAVVASAAGGLVEIVRDGKTGFLIPQEDDKALADALLKLLRNKQLAEQMGKKGHELALRHFSRKTFVDKFLRLYQTDYLQLK